VSAHISILLADVAGIFSVGLWSSGIRLAVPTALAAIGEAVSQRSGVLNLGLEGMMMMGAYAGFAVTAETGRYELGLAAGVLAGALIAAIMAFSAVVRHANQIVTGFALVLLGQGLANFLYAQSQAKLQTFEPMSELDLAPLSGIPGIGDVVFRQNVLAYLTVGLAIAIWLTLRFTRFGLEVDASGSDPVAAAAKGVHVVRTRTIATLLAGAFAGLGGAAITLGAVGNFGHNITAGKGFVAIALVAIARNRIPLVLLAAFVFGTLEALQARLQDVGGIPIEFLPAIPWLTVVLALVFIVYARRLGVRRAAVSSD
jgi:general nucleoside transport system permease protein